MVQSHACGLLGGEDYYPEGHGLLAVFPRARGGAATSIRLDGGHVPCTTGHYSVVVVSLTGLARAATPEVGRGLETCGRMATSITFPVGGCVCARTPHFDQRLRLSARYAGPL